LQRLTEHDPHHRPALLHLCQLASMQNNFSAAFESAERAVMADPACFDARLEAGKLALVAGRSETAARYLDALLDCADLPFEMREEVRALRQQCR
jgi:hypothetical protein